MSGPYLNMKQHGLLLDCLHVLTDRFHEQAATPSSQEVDLLWKLTKYKYSTINPDPTPYG